MRIYPLTLPCLATLVAVALSACAQIEPRHPMHREAAVGKNAPSPSRMVLLPPDIKLYEIGLSGIVEEVPAWSQQGRANFERVMNSASDLLQPGLSVALLPKLSAEERSLVDEYVALLGQVADAAVFTTQQGGKAWRHKSTHFDYSVGPGLSFLRDRSGADAALFLVAQDASSSKARVWASVLTTVLFGAPLGWGSSFVGGATVDLKTGDVLWVNYVAKQGGRDLRKPEDARAMLQELFKSARK